MKKISITFVTLLLLCSLFTMKSCKKDNTTFTTEYTAAQPIALSPAVGADGTVFFTGTTVDLKWSADNKGPAASWDVYFGTSKSPALFQSGVSQPSVTVTVSDGITYYWKVISTDANGIVTTSETYKFTAVNGTNPKLTVNLNVTTDVLSAIGVILEPDKVVDLRFLILKKSDMSIVGTVDDGFANEVYRGFQTLPDGEYVLGVDIFSTINAGTINAPVNLSLQLKFVQLGVIDTLLDYPNVMTNANPCNLYRTYLSTVKKIGSAYTITRTVSFLKPEILTWKGDDATFPSQVTTTASCTSKTMTGLGFGWMLDWWGEVIISGGTLTYTSTATTITIPLQAYCKTTYLGAAQPAYSIQGTGTIDNSGAYPVWTIHYDFKQGNTFIAQYLLDNAAWPTNYFEAIITTNPAKGVANYVLRPDKPKR